MAYTLKIRLARINDLDAILAMQHRAMRELAAAVYGAATIEEFIQAIGTMDVTIIERGRYFVAETSGVLAGCGGWSMQTPNYAQAIMDDGSTAQSPHVRSVYVNPDFSRQGLGQKIMKVIEADMACHDAWFASLTATLSGVPLYRKLGYRPSRQVHLHLPSGALFEGLNMEKMLRYRVAA